MDYKEAIQILLKIPEKYSFSTEEKEAIIMAVSTLDAGSLIDTRFKGIIKNRKTKRNKSLKL